MHWLLSHGHRHGLYSVGSPTDLLGWRPVSHLLHLGWVIAGVLMTVGRLWVGRRLLVGVAWTGHLRGSAAGWGGHWVVELKREREQLGLTKRKAANY